MTSPRQLGIASAMLGLLVLVGLGGSRASQAESHLPDKRSGGREVSLPGQLQRAPQQFGAMVSRVRVDVVVTSGDGGFVADLQADEFEVYEDGARQKILDVQLVDLAAGRVRSLIAATAPIADEPAAQNEADESEADEGSARNDASDLGAVIFLVDGPSLNLAAKARFGDAWTKLLEQTNMLQVPRAAYMVDNRGHIEELAPLGDDLETLRAAADAVRAAPFFGTSVRRRLLELAADMTDTFSLEAGRRRASAKARIFEDEERNRALATYELLTAFADALWSRSGRTAVVWVSTGVKLMRGGPYTTLLSGRPPWSSDLRIKKAQDALHRAANASNVSFYAIDPSLLSSTRSLGGDVEVRDFNAAELLSTPALERSLDGLRDSMRMAAAATGGRAYIQATDIAMVLEEIESDTSRFYLISYEPPRSRSDGEYHEITVEVLRDDVDVRARGGYVDRPPEERVRRSIEAALALPGVVTELPVSAEAFRSQALDGGPNLLSAVAVDGGELGLAVGPDGEPYVSIDVHAVLLDKNGTVASAHEQLSARPGANGAFRSEDSPMPPTVFDVLVAQREWTLHPGDYVLNTAVRDNISGKLGATSIEVEIPVTDGAWTASDPLIVATNAAGRTQPVVLGRVLEGQNVSVHVEVYGGVQPVLSGQVFMERHEGDDPEQRARLSAIAMRPDGAGAHRGSLPLPPTMRPGRYVVQLQITDRRADESKIVRLPVEVVKGPASGR